MKFYGILKDSFREAVDAKVFYVMVGLSVFLTLLTATLSFKPGPADKLMPLLALPLTVDNMEDLQPERLMTLALEPGFHAYEVKEAKPLDGAPEGPGSPYRIVLVAHSKSEDEAAKLRAAPEEALGRIRNRFGALDELRLMDVREARLATADDAFVPKDADAKDVYFEVTAQPTAAARRLWPHEPSLFFGALPMSFLGELPLGMQLYLLEDQVVNGFGAWIAILISIVITAFFIPNMLRKGTVDLLLVKPIHRVTLLLYKYVGGLLFIFLNTTVAVLGVWVALGLRSGVWAPSFLLTILVIIAFFAILYAVSTLFSVLTQSPVAAILLTCAVWFVLYVVGAIYQYGEALRKQEERHAAAAARGEQSPEEVRAAEGNGPHGVAEPAPPHKEAEEKSGARGRPGGQQELPGRSDNWFFRTVQKVHFVLPRTKDLDHLMSLVLIRDLLTANQVKAQKLDNTRVSWGESLTVSGAFVAIVLGLSCFRFATKDY
jgi:ABC-type transport system involved in multi-copper enzyme maturation permease subunit